MIGEWKHPGGKLREERAQSLTEEELLAILISTGIPGKSAGEIAREVLQKYVSYLKVICNVSLIEYN